MPPDINGERGRRQQEKELVAPDRSDRPDRMVERTKSAPLQNLSSSSSSLNQSQSSISSRSRKHMERSVSSTIPGRTTPRFPKNTSRSLSPKPRFPANSSRSRSHSSSSSNNRTPKKERKENTRRAAKESLLDSASQLKTGPVRDLLRPQQQQQALASPPDTAPQSPRRSKDGIDKAPQSPIRKGEVEDVDLKNLPRSPLKKSKSSMGPTTQGLDRTPGSPLRASTGTMYKTPDDTKATAAANRAVKGGPKSPTRRGRKDTVGGNRNTSKLPVISPLDMDDNDDATPPRVTRPRSPKGGKKQTIGSGAGSGTGTSGNNNRSLSKLPALNLDQDDDKESSKSLDEDDTIVSMPMDASIKKQQQTTKSPRSRKKDAVAAGNRSLSKLPTLNLDQDDNAPKGNNKTQNLDEDDTIVSIDHWADIPPPELDRHRSETYSPQSKPKDLPPSATKSADDEDGFPELPTLTPGKGGNSKKGTSTDPFHTPMDTSVRPKSPSRKGAKETVKGNSSISDFPKLSPLHDNDDDRTERRRNEQEFPDTTFELDAWPENNEDGQEQDNDNNKKAETKVSTMSGDAFPVDEAWDPFNTTTEDPFKNAVTPPPKSEDSTTKKSQQEAATTKTTPSIAPIPPPQSAKTTTAAGETKRIPPKQRSRGSRKPGANNNSSSNNNNSRQGQSPPAPFKRSTTGDDLGSGAGGGAAAPFRRSHTHNVGERSEQQRKPSIAPRNNKPVPTEKAVASAFRGGRAESILNHPLVGPNGMDLSMSVSEVNHTKNSNAADVANPVPNHQRRARGSSLEDRSSPSRGGGSEIQETSRNSISSQRSNVSSSRRRSASGRRGRSSIPSSSSSSRKQQPGSEHEKRKMRKSRSSPEGSLERSKSSTESLKRSNTSEGSLTRSKSSNKAESPDQSRRNQRWTSDKRGGDTNNRRARGSQGESKPSVSPDGRDRRRDSGSVRRARSRQRPPEDRGKGVGEGKNHELAGGNDSIASLKESVKRANGDRTTTTSSHSPARPRGRPGGASFPRNVARSVSPSRGRGRGTSPPPGSKHRRNLAAEASSRSRSASPSSSSRHRRTTGGQLPSGSRHQQQQQHQRSASPTRTRPSPSNSQRESSQRGARSSPNSSQRDLRNNNPNSSQRDLRNTKPHNRDDNNNNKELTPTPAPRESTSLAPPSGPQQHRPSLSLSNVFDLEIKADGGDSDSSRSEQSDTMNTVVQFDPTNASSVSSFKPSPDDPSLNNSGVFKMENLKNKDELEDGSGSQSGGGYLPGNMALSSNHQKSKSSLSPQSDGSRRRRASEHRRQSSSRNNNHNSSTSRRSPRGEGGRRVRGGGRDNNNNNKKGGEDGGNPRPSLNKGESLRVEDVFDESSKSESFAIDDQHGGSSRPQQQHRDSISSHGSAASFGGTESDRSRRGRRQRLRQKLREKEQQRQVAAPRRGGGGGNDDDDDSEGGSVYLPAAIATTPKSLSPVRSGLNNNDDEDNDASKELMADTDDDDEESEKRRSSSALSYVKKQFLNQTNQIKNEVNVLKDKVRSYRDKSNEGSSTFNLESDQEPDPYNKKSSSKSEKSSVGKKLKGLFQSKNKKHSHQLLGGGESDSDYSAGVF